MRVFGIKNCYSVKLHGTIVNEQKLEFTSNFNQLIFNQRYKITQFKIVFMKFIILCTRGIILWYIEPSGF